MTEQRKRFIVVAGIIVLAILSRLMPHPANFTPIAAIALFGGAYFLNKKWAYLVPLMAMLLTDGVLQVLFMTGFRDFPGFYPDMIFVYGSIGIVVAIGMMVGRKINVLTVMSGAVGASLVFFLVTNFGSWLTLPMYTKDIAGLVEAYIAGIPFYKYTMLGDLIYSAIVFGVFESILASKPEWRLATS